MFFTYYAYQNVGRIRDLIGNDEVEEGGLDKARKRKSQQGVRKPLLFDSNINEVEKIQSEPPLIDRIMSMFSVDDGRKLNSKKKDATKKDSMKSRQDEPGGKIKRSRSLFGSGGNMKKSRSQSGSGNKLKHSRSQNGSGTKMKHSRSLTEPGGKLKHSRSQIESSSKLKNSRSQIESSSKLKHSRSQPESGGKIKHSRSQPEPGLKINHSRSALAASNMREKIEPQKKNETNSGDRKARSKKDTTKTEKAEGLRATERVLNKYKNSYHMKKEASVESTVRDEIRDEIPQDKKVIIENLPTIMEG